jgi:uncharacterized protein YuzE
MKISYSDHADVLYIVLSTPGNPCSYIEMPNNMIVRIDDVTHQVVGVTIYNFMYKMKRGERISIPEIGEDLSGEYLLSLSLKAS